MGLNLPKWEELSRDEQIPIVNLPIGGNYVVVGGPGTGKTVLAIYRAARWRRENEAANKVLFLVYNRTLMQYISDSLNSVQLPSSYSETWHSWIWHLYKAKTKEIIPSIAPFKYDWPIVKEKLMDGSLKDSIDYLILDEAQDFPLELLEILNHLAKNATIFGDSQQALDQSSTTSDFSFAFSAERRVYYLNQNFRNTVEIASVAQLFYAGDPHDIPARPRRRGEKPRLIQCANSAEMAKIVSNYYNNNKSQHIGVLTPTHTLAKDFQDNLKLLQTPSQIYTSGKQVGKDYFSFDDFGIKIMSYNTMKGLEFDAVFLPYADNNYFLAETEKILKRVYVACTRAKYTLSFLFTDDNNSFILRRLNNNSELLNRSKNEDSITLKL